VRGLAAACKLQGRYTEAIGYYERVLLISQAMGEFTGVLLAKGLCSVLLFVCCAFVSGAQCGAWQQHANRSLPKVPSPFNLRKVHRAIGYYERLLLGTMNACCWVI
jgi:hypothetical protein